MKIEFGAAIDQVLKPKFARLKCHGFVAVLSSSLVRVPPHPWEDVGTQLHNPLLHSGVKIRPLVQHLTRLPDVNKGTTYLY